ncbi:uncharacterized protein LOC132619603 [Lycium barbarum]|uniref:uncharacterized protein LOC132619603 n=1 Tax=Lycium barbarum TaxID=112863 RepID=UPI00293F67FE|nr:uncharacterized protein LOC132619603 [Lycium barbarum]
MTLETFLSHGLVRCPCVKCQCRNYENPEIVRLHLYKDGFQKDYTVWTSHGEMNSSFGRFQDFVVGESSRSVEPNVQSSRMHDMVQDAYGMHSDFESGNHGEEAPNEEASRFFEQLKKASQPLYDGSPHSQLSIAVRLLSIKADWNVPQGAMDAVIGLIHELVDPNLEIPENYYKAKRLVSKLGLSSMRIDCCENGCMLYYKDDEGLECCKFCGRARFKRTRSGKRVAVKAMHYLPLTPRLKRLYASNSSAPHMRWHSENRRPPGVMCHPSDGEAWKHFDTTYPDFAAETRNIRLGLCSDGFTPHSVSAAPYSCWPVFLTLYNLPPELWVETFDVSLKQNFNLRATLMWTINDFPAYGMLSGWMTAGKLSCPYCMENTKSFTLKHGKKHSWFDCHRQFLPLDHEFRSMKNGFRKNKIERNYPPPRLSGEEIWERVENFPKVTEEPPYKFDGYVMDVKGKTKDNPKARLDLQEYCMRKELWLQDKGNGVFKPKASYSFTMDHKRKICEWVKNLKMPDGYASNLEKRVDMAQGKLHGMKSHDCHVFMETLLPIAFSSLPARIWKPMKEISLFFKDLCSSTLRVDNLDRMHQNIPVITSKLEKILPPGFFDVMEYLPIHLAEEARLGGPVHCRWMYPFERTIGKSKRGIKQKHRVEGSICEAYLAKETTHFCSYYFGNDVPCLRNRPNRHYEGGENDALAKPISIFNQPGSGSKKRTRQFNDMESKFASIHVC